MRLAPQSLRERLLKSSLNLTVQYLYTHLDLPVVSFRRVCPIL
jgi:hypothetical protein